MTNNTEFSRILSKIDASLERLEASLIDNTPFGHRWVDQHEICRLLKVTTRTLKTYREQGLIPYSRIGGKVFFRLCDIEEQLTHNLAARKGKEKQIRAESFEE